MELQKATQNILVGYNDHCSDILNTDKSNKKENYNSSETL